MPAVAPPANLSSEEFINELAVLYRTLCKKSSSCEQELQKLSGDGAALSTDAGSSNYGSEPSDSSSDSFTAASEEFINELAVLYRTLCKKSSSCDKCKDKLQKLSGDCAALSTDVGSSNYGSEPSDSSSDSFTVASEEGSTEWGSHVSEPLDSSSDSPAASTELSEDESSSSGHDSEPADDSAESVAAHSEVLEDLLTPSDCSVVESKLLEEEAVPSCTALTCGSTSTGSTMPDACTVRVQPWLYDLVLATLTFLSTMTTVVVKGLPPHCSRKFLLEHFELNDGSVNFLDVPWNANQRRQCPYCFINFTSASKAWAFWDCWNGRYLAKAKKPLSILLAEVQGLQALVKQYLARKGAKCPPIVFNGDQQIDFAGLLVHLGMLPEE